jgi:electron transfer flavoprotein alpha subunit
MLAVLERELGGIDELSLQALAFARGIANGAPVHAVVVGTAGESLATIAGEHGASTLHVAEHDVFSAYAPAAVAHAVADLIEQLGETVVVGPGSDRGNEVLAYVAARLDLPLATNCLAVELGEPTLVTRQRWGGSLLEEARLHANVTLLTVAPHAVAAEAVPGRAEADVERFAPTLDESDLAVHVIDRVQAASSGVSLAEAKVVVSGGRGVGSAEGFAAIEELAALLNGAVGCSRVVTSAGWRPHTDQVGQTGTKISPDLYIPCGISGATQHMAGCRGAKKILAINADADAPIMAGADYAVIGDLHEVVPAISAEIRRVRAG